MTELQRIKYYQKQNYNENAQNEHKNAFYAPTDRCYDIHKYIDYDGTIKVIMDFDVVKDLFEAVALIQGTWYMTNNPDTLKGFTPRQKAMIYEYASTIGKLNVSADELRYLIHKAPMWDNRKKSR